MAIPGLAPEQSFGFDAGVDQKLFDDRVTASVTGFDTRYRNLIDFAAVAVLHAVATRLWRRLLLQCRPRRDQAASKLSGDVILVPDEWRARASYTYLIARDLDNDTTLLQRPRDKAHAVARSTRAFPSSKSRRRLTLVSAAMILAAFRTVELAPYAKLDLFANYKFNDNVTIFGRIENLTDARYEEAYNYGVAGRSFYGGVKVTW